MKNLNVAVIGGGPAGLMAAETLAKSGVKVTVYERKPSLGRKFLMAGRGGLNLTHSEDLPKFKSRYGSALQFLSPLIDEFSPQSLRAWCAELDEPAFIGSSGRIFPESFKASPLLRKWIGRLNGQEVKFNFRHTWMGWDENERLIFDTPDKTLQTVKPDFTLLALGGASWPSLGSDGSWVEFLKKKNIGVAPLQPANCGFEVDWSDVFRQKFAGKPLKSITASFGNEIIPGEIMITDAGIEGGAVYALSSRLRSSLQTGQETVFHLDLRPTLPRDIILKKLSRPRKGQSFSTYLQKVLSLSSLSIHLLREADAKVPDYPAAQLADLIKAVPVHVRKPFPIAKSISTAGGIELGELNCNSMLKKYPGVFIAGEMLDWEAPTGGYLLQACFATGYAAGRGILNYAKIS